MGQFHSHTNKVLAITDDNPANPYFLSSKHCDLLQKSWPIVDEYGPEKIGAVMFKALYKIHPESFQMFSSFSDDPNWETSVHFKHHCRVVVAVIGSGIKTLKTPEVLCPHLEFLGFQHKLRDIHIVHFKCLGEEMVKALEGALKPMGNDKWNDDIKAAWADLYDRMAEIIKKHMDLNAEEQAASDNWVGKQKAFEETKKQ